MAPIDPPELRRLAAFMAGLPNCPRGCPNDAVYPSPTFRIPAPGDTIDDQVSGITARYEREAAGQLQRHLTEDHQTPDVDRPEGEGDRCSACGDPMKPGYRYSRCCFAPVVGEESEEICEVHDTPMADGVCSSCLADAAHDGR